ncbi:hypothetical protein B1A_16602 [mine drainage metagenome]|uniref:Uncharacterized protein n=1 Tax=mine drainage metagenome TaxID=410659 RepID=T0YWV9_9ZZZZ
MATNGLLRHQMIESLMARHPKGVVDGAIVSWEQLATHLVSIIGESGFNSLYARSVFLAQSTFPWLVASSPLPQTDDRFVELRISFEGQTPVQVSEANSLLLIIFTDVLASLIGEQLTTKIVRSSWGINVQDRADKGFSDE